MVDLIQETLTRGEVFWTAIEALATVGALAFLLIEIPRIRREAAAHKVEGLKLAREQLQSNDFQGWFQVIQDVWKAGEEEYPDHIDGEIFEALGRLDYVAKLIELGYVDRELLFYEFSGNLFFLERFPVGFKV